MTSAYSMLFVVRHGTRSLRPCSAAGRKLFSSSQPRSTDGVFRELTAQRTSMPWIEAFRNQQKGKSANQESASRPSPRLQRDLAPKKMKDSYHSVVGIEMDVASVID